MLEKKEHCKATSMQNVLSFGVSSWIQCSTEATDYSTLSAMTVFKLVEEQLSGPLVGLKLESTV